MRSAYVLFAAMFDEESGISKEWISFLRNFAITWTKYKGHRERMRKQLWSDSGEPQIRGSWAENGNSQKTWQRTVKSGFLVWSPRPSIQPLLPLATFPWGKPAPDFILPYPWPFTSELPLPLPEVLSVSQHKCSSMFCGFMGHTVV